MLNNNYHCLCEPTFEAIEDGEHSHCCPNCGTCWKHGNDLPYRDDISDDDLRAAHLCPNCGTEQRSRHHVKGSLF